MLSWFRLASYRHWFRRKKNGNTNDRNPTYHILPYTLTPRSLDYTELSKGRHVPIFQIQAISYINNSSLCSEIWCSSYADEWIRKFSKDTSIVQLIPIYCYKILNTQNHSQLAFFGRTNHIWLKIPLILEFWNMRDYLHNLLFIVGTCGICCCCYCRGRVLDGRPNRHEHRTGNNNVIKLCDTDAFSVHRIGIKFVSANIRRIS